MGREERSRLTPQDWSRAALQAMSTGGLAAVAVEPLAAALGTTKGSFYWHFRNRDALVEASLALWEQEHTEAVIALVEAETDPLARLRTLLTVVIGSTGEDSLELAVLATADHPLVAPVLARVTQRRIDYTVRLFRGLGFSAAQARHRGLLAFTRRLSTCRRARRGSATSIT